MDEIVSHKWDRDKLSFQVQWNLGDMTWESYEDCKELQALDDYLQLLGVSTLADLPRRPEATRRDPSGSNARRQNEAN